MEKSGPTKHAAQKKGLHTAMVRPFQSFFSKESAGGVLLLAAAATAFAWANSPYSASYHYFWDTPISLQAGDGATSMPLREWINEGLMAFFFFVVGLEIKRELFVGELSTIRKALLPAGAALGGMIVPALIYLLLNRGRETAVGWGIPMATDIAFALGALHLMGKRVPSALRVFLSALAIVDDIGAVLVIAVFYTTALAPGYLAAAFGVMFLLLAANLLSVRSLAVYSMLGFLLWGALLQSGVHATIAGVFVALCIPARGKYDTDRFARKVSEYLKSVTCGGTCGFSILRNQAHLSAVQSIEIACRNVETPLQRLEHGMMGWVAYVVVPLFALANAGITLADTDLRASLSSSVLLGIVLGLALGKPIGILLFSWGMVKTGAAALPQRVRWRHVLGTGMLGGIGFTMSLFISDISFPGGQMHASAKLGILGASVISALLGSWFLLTVSRRSESKPA